MQHLKALLIEFLNKKDITNGDVILTSIISSALFLVIISLLKPLKSYFIKLFNKISNSIKKKIRYYKGRVTFNDLIEIENKQKKGLKLSKREKELLDKNHKIIRDSLSKISFNINNFPNINDFKIDKK